MCFAPQRRALFRHLNFQKRSERSVFCTFWLWDVLRATTACTFSTSQLPKCSEHDEVFCAFWVGNLPRATAACTFSSLIWPGSSAPAALASLLFDSPEPQIIGKTQCFATLLPFRALGSSFFWDFLFFNLLSSSLLSLTLPISAFHLSILSEVWLLNILRQSFYPQKLLHSKAFTHRLFGPRSFTHRKAFTQRSFYAQKLLDIEALSHRTFHTEKLLDTKAFAHRSFYTEAFTQKLLRTEAFTHRSFCTQKRYTQKTFCTAKL